MKFVNPILCSIFFIILIKAESCTNTKDLLVEIQNGKLKGQDRGYYYSYESIPYAEPPIGDLRFEAPQPYQQKWSGVFNASVKPKLCMQWSIFEQGENKLTGVEDCLTINVYKPKTGKTKYPVIIYIHGGAFMFSAPNDFSEELLMKSGKVILVSMSYRLGPLGFLSTEDTEITGNFGLKDQQLALKWTKDNIAKFGGDTEKMLLIGFSAGAASTHLQMLQATLKETAKAVISFSGTALNPWAILKDSRKSAIKLANHLHCPNTADTKEIKNCLKKKKAEDVVTSVKEFLNIGYNPFTTFGPVVEHKNAKNSFLTEHPIDIIKSGHFSHLPWLASYASQDACYPAAELLENNPKTGKKIIDELNENWLELAPKNLFLSNIKDDPVEYAKQLKEQYLGSLKFSQENFLKVEEMYTDVLFKIGIHEALQLHSLYAKAPVYGYIYDNPAEYNVGDFRTKRGTCHADDFSLMLSFPTPVARRPDEQVISQKFVKMLEDFVEKDELTFGDCKFENNAGKSGKIKQLLITKDKCETVTRLF